MRKWSRDSVTFEQKATAGVLACGALLVAGWLAADSLSSSSASGGRTTTATARAAALGTVVTVTSVRTVRGPRRVVTQDVPVTNRVLVRAKQKVVTTTVLRTSTAFGTNTVYRNLPATTVTQVVTAPPQTVTRLVTTVQWRVITIAQKASTVTITVPAP